VFSGISNSNISGEKTENGRGLFDYWVLKLDKMGNVIKDKTIGGTGDDTEVWSLEKTTDSGYIFGGNSNSNISGEKTEDSRGDYDYWVVKLDNELNIQWDKTLGGSSYDALFNLKEVRKDQFIISGLSWSDVSGDKKEPSRGAADYWIVWLNGTGQLKWYRDADGDGFGDPASFKEAKGQPRGYVSNNLDCNDKNKTKGGPEVCDGIDNDCDGIIDDGLSEITFYSDFDGDGYGSEKRTITACAAPPRFVAVAGDLNDDNKNVYPDAPEICDGRDNNQDGQIDEGFTKRTFYHDFDKDGYGRETVTLQACAAPLNYEAVAGDCNDRDASIHQGAKDLCNGKDDDCDGLIDEDCNNAVTKQDKAEANVSEQGLKLELTAIPNPASHNFTLRIQSTSSKSSRGKRRPASQRYHCSRPPLQCRCVLCRGTSGGQTSCSKTGEVRTVIYFT
jgi:hypothetical protein